MSFRFTLLSALLVLFIAGCPPDPTPQELAYLKADSLVAAAVNETNLSGAILTVCVDGHMVFYNKYGNARAYAFGGEKLLTPTPMQPASVFDLASLTKVFATTMGMMLLVDQDKVDLEAPVKTYLPQFKGAHKDSVTVRHLLSHTAGLAPWQPVYYHATNADEAAQYIYNLDLAYPVGKERHYSDLGFMLLGYIIETVSGQSLDGYLQAHLYQPMGLKSTGFTPSDIPDSLFVATSHGNPFEKRMVEDDNFGYHITDKPNTFSDWRQYILAGEVNDGNAFHAHQGMAGHAGLFSNAIELQELLTLLLNKGTFLDTQYITPETVDLFLQPDFTGNGLGWGMSSRVFIAEDVPAGSFGHTGFTGTYALAVPAYNLGIVLLTNRQHAGVDEEGRYPSMNPLRRSVVDAILTGWETP